MANLQEKLNTLLAERAKLSANLNAYNGAIEVLQQLIADEAKDPQVVSPVEAPKSGRKAKVIDIPAPTDAK